MKTYLWSKIVPLHPPPCKETVSSGEILLPVSPPGTDLPDSGPGWQDGRPGAGHQIVVPKKSGRSSPSPACILGSRLWEPAL